MSKCLYNSICYFYKKAVDVPDWADPDFQDDLEKLKRVEKIEKDPRLVNFREKAPISVTVSEEHWEKEMIYDIRYQFGTVINAYKVFEDRAIIYPDLKKYQKDFEQIYALCSAFMDGNHLEIIRTNIMPVGKQNLRFVKAYNTVYEKYNKYVSETNIKYEGFLITHGIKKFDDLKGKSEWSARVLPTSDSTYEIVFTTKHMDILGMSSRGDWTSCQTIDDRAKYLSLAKSVLGSCLSKYVGIIYFTDGSDYKGRGERMLRRCAAWLVKNKDDDYVIFLQKMYPQEFPILRKVFEDCLKKHTGLPTTSNSHFLKKILEDYPEGIKDPYDDSDLPYDYSYNGVLQQVRAGDLSNIYEISPEERKKMFDQLYKETGKVAPYVRLIDPDWDNGIDLYEKAINEDINSLHYIKESNSEKYKNFILSLVDRFKDSKEIFSLIIKNYVNPSWKEYKDAVIDALMMGINLFRDVPAEYLSKDLLLKIINNNKEDYNFVNRALLHLSDFCSNDDQDFKDLIYEYADKHRSIAHYARLQWGDLYKQILIKAVKKYPQEYYPYIKPDWDFEGMDEVVEQLAMKDIRFFNKVKKTSKKLPEIIISLVSEQRFPIKEVFSYLSLDKIEKTELIRVLFDKGKHMINLRILLSILPYAPEAPSFEYMKQNLLNMLDSIVGNYGMSDSNWKFDDDFITKVAYIKLVSYVHISNSYDPQLYRKIRQIEDKYNENTEALRLLENAEEDPESFFMHFKKEWDLYNKARLMIFKLFREKPKLLLLLNSSWHSDNRVIEEIVHYAILGRVSCDDVPLPLKEVIAKRVPSSLGFSGWDKYK